MTGSGVIHRFIVGEWWITRSLSSGAHSRDPLANPPCELDVSKRTRRRKMQARRTPRRLSLCGCKAEMRLA
jgi:hypothetical protein